MLDEQQCLGQDLPLQTTDTPLCACPTSALGPVVHTQTLYLCSKLCTCTHACHAQVGLREVAVANQEDMLGCLVAGLRARTTAATSANAASSRSHAILTFRLRQVGMQYPHCF
jgi:hypothetical protein